MVIESGTPAWLIRALLVSLGCPGPRCCGGLWPVDHDTLESVRPHMEAHMAVVLGNERPQ